MFRRAISLYVCWLRFHVQSASWLRSEVWVSRVSGCRLHHMLDLNMLMFGHSRPQSLRSFWPAAGIESSGSNHYERTKEITEFWLSGSLRICIYGAWLKWLLPELSIPAAGQKDRRLWGREWRLIWWQSGANFFSQSHDVHVSIQTRINQQ